MRAIFPTITKEKQHIYEDFAFLKGNAKYKEGIPCICGYYGRACRNMDKVADSMSCMHCPLSNFASIMEAIEEYSKTTGYELKDLYMKDIGEIHMMLQDKVWIKTDLIVVKTILEYLKKADNYMNFYFIFGSASTFPYQGGYLIVRATNMEEATKKFRWHYPDRHENCLNCAFVYTQEQWDEISSDMGKCHKVI